MLYVSGKQRSLFTNGLIPRPHATLTGDRRMLLAGYPMKTVQLKLTLRRFDTGVEVNIPLTIDGQRLKSVPGFRLPEHAVGGGHIRRDIVVTVPVGTVATMAVVSIHGRPIVYSVRMPDGAMIRTVGHLPRHVTLSPSHAAALSALTGQETGKIVLRQEIGRRTIVRVPVWYTNKKIRIVDGVSIPSSSGDAEFSRGDAVIRIAQERYGQSTAWAVVSESGTLLAQGVGAPSGLIVEATQCQTEGLRKVFGLDPFGSRRADEWAWWARHASPLTEAESPWSANLALRRQGVDIAQAILQESAVTV